MLLVCSQAVCLLALLRRRDFPLLTIYLLMAIPATLSFRAESAWLYAWYPLLVWPVALLRLSAGLEVVHRQTRDFFYPLWLLGSVLLLAASLAGLGWVRSDQIGQLQVLVEWRRLLQIFGGFVFLVLELFWLLQVGRFRRIDALALAFGVIVWNHAGVSLGAGLHRFTLAGWAQVERWSWGLDAVGYLGIATVIRWLPKSARRAPSGRSIPGAVPGSRFSTHR